MGHGSRIAPVLHLDLGIMVFNAQWLLQKIIHLKNRQWLNTFPRGSGVALR